MKKAMNSFLDNTVLQAVLSIMVWGVIGYLYAIGQDVPEALLGAGSVILGFYFHTSAVAATARLK